MPIEEMLAALEQEGKDHCQKILSDARAQAKKTIEEEEKAGKELEKTLMADADRKLEIERSKATKAAYFNINKAVAEKKEGLIEKLFGKLNESLVNNNKGSSSEILKKLADEVIDLVKTSDEEVLVSVNEKDVDNVKGILNSMGIKHRFENNQSISGGLKVRTADGKISVDNTFESRALKAQQLYKPEIIEMLFGEK